MDLEACGQCRARRLPEAGYSTVMKIRLIALLLLLLFLSAPFATAQDSAELRKLAEAVSRARYEPGPDRERTITELNELSQRIGVLIEKGTLTARRRQRLIFIAASLRLISTISATLMERKQTNLWPGRRFPIWIR